MQVLFKDVRETLEECEAYIGKRLDALPAEEVEASEEARIVANIAWVLKSSREKSPLGVQVVERKAPGGPADTGQ